MTPLHPSPALPATADADAKARRDGTHLGHVDLVAIGGAFEIHGAAAMRAAGRDGRFELPVDRSDGGAAVAVTAVGLAGLAARPGGLVGRLSLGERCRLALSRAAGVGQEAFELRDAGVAFGQTRGDRDRARPPSA
jgi:hypothetical protein